MSCFILVILVVCVCLVTGDQKLIHLMLKQTPMLDQTDSFLQSTD